MKSKVDNSNIYETSLISAATSQANIRPAGSVAILELCSIADNLPGSLTLLSLCQHAVSGLQKNYIMLILKGQ